MVLDVIRGYGKVFGVNFRIYNSHVMVIEGHEREEKYGG